MTTCPKAFAKVFVQATQPRTAHTAVDAIECSGHTRSLGAQALCKNRIERNLGSDLSEGRVSLRANFDIDFDIDFVIQKEET